MPTMQNVFGERGPVASSRFGVRPIGLLLSVVLAVSGAGSPAVAQEIRVAGGMGYSGVDEVGFTDGFGAGLRYFLPDGIGIGIEFDRLAPSPDVYRVTCGVTGEDCLEEDVAAETDVDFTSLLLMYRAGGENWAMRMGVGRTAGVVTSVGIGSMTGRSVLVPAADAGRGDLAWSRGADGSLIVFELHRRLPVPGPFPISVYGGFRFHQVQMEGCEIGDYSPLCGNQSVTLLEGGLNLGLWPESEDSP